MRQLAPRNSAIVFRARGVLLRAAGRVARLFAPHAASLTLEQFFSRFLSPGDVDVSAPMDASSAVYAAVRAISQTAASLPCVLHRAGKPDEPITAGPAFDLMRSPRPGLSAAAFVEEWVGFLAESGEAHLIPILGLATGELRGLQTVGARQMQPDRAVDGTLLGWRFTPVRAVARDLAAAAVITARLWNPYDDVRGLSPLAAAGLAVKQDYLAATFNAASLANGAAPAGIYTLPDSPTPEQRREFERAIQERHGGAANAGRHALLWGGADFKPTSMKAADLDLIAGRKFSREEIFSAFGVPPVIASVFEQAHYDVADQSIEIFLLHTVAPILKALADTLSLFVLPRVEPGVVVRFDLSAHPVMQRLQLKKLESLERAIRNGVPFNEAADLVGLPLARQKWGDTSLLATGYDRAEDVASGAAAESRGLPDREKDDEPPPAGKKPAKRKDDESDDDAAASIQTAASVAAIVRDERKAIADRIPRVRNLWRAHTQRQLNILSRRLSSAVKHSALAPSAHVTEEEAAEIARRAQLDLAEEKRRARELVILYFPAVAESSLVQWLIQFGWTRAEAVRAARRLVAGKGVRSLVRIQAGKIAGLEETNRRRIFAQIVRGLTRGETINEIRERMRVVLQGKQTGSGELQQARINSIARNEVGSAVGLGRFLAIRASGLDGKSWRHGANPRDTHVEATERYSLDAPIPIDQPFEVGTDELMFPRDPAGSAGEVINCNCVLIPRRLPRQPRPAPQPEKKAS